MYTTTIDFNEFDEIWDTWETAFDLPNGACFKFWRCTLKFIYTKEIKYLQVISDQKQNIEECLTILSFFSNIPLVIRGISKYNEVLPEVKQQDKMSQWLTKLQIIENGLNRKKNRKKRQLILNLMRMYSIGLQHEYREYIEEEFLMCFKPIEVIAKLVIESERLFSKTKHQQRKVKTQSFLNHLLTDSLSTELDIESIDNLSGDLINSLNRFLKGRNYTRILLAWNQLKIKIAENYEFLDPKIKAKFLEINSRLIHELVDIRNSIAHGKICEISENNISNLHFLSCQFISLYVLEEPYSEFYLPTKKFGSRF
ncbi:hypothetical protein [Streptococcus parasanguinis]|uniref:hypothetical protein n=1 Tax=Streptococcus parasanguinis TaxID=1318 RepID=UPI001898B836|nr:hypothetical protein [Streptococcus parasanguinis]